MQGHVLNNHLPSLPPQLIGNSVLGACACGHDYGVCRPVKQHHGLHDSGSETFFSEVILPCSCPLWISSSGWWQPSCRYVGLCHVHESQPQRGQDQCMGANQKRGQGSGIRNGHT